MPFGGLPLAEDDVINLACRLHGADDTDVYVHSWDVMAVMKRIHAANIVDGQKFAG